MNSASIHRSARRALLAVACTTASALAQQPPPAGDWTEAPPEDDEELEVDAATEPEPEPEDGDVEIDATPAPVETPPIQERQEPPIQERQEPLNRAGQESAPAPASNREAPPQETVQVESTASADRGWAGLAATAPVGDVNAPRSLVAEGSNYVRPLRRGLAWWGFVQAQYERNQLSEDQLDPSGHPLNHDQFVLRRARLRIDHGWEHAAATLEMDGSTVDGSLDVALRRAEASLLYRGNDDDGVAPLLVLTAGVTDLPFGAEIGESQRDRVFMERSLGSLALFPTEADIGLKLWGAYRFVNYAVAVVNGQPLNAEGGLLHDPNAANDIVGRVGTVAKMLDDLTVEGGLSFYEGKGFSPGRQATKDTVTWVDDNNNGFAEPHEIQGTTGSAALPSQNFERWALGLDIGLSLQSALGLSRLNGEAVVASNLDRGLLESNPILSGADARQLVLTFSLVQQITDYGLIGFRAAHYDPNVDLIEQRAGTFHLRNQSYWVLSPAVGLTLSHGRLVAQYDFVADRLGRDHRGVPTDIANNQVTIRLQVDL